MLRELDGVDRRRLRCLTTMGCMEGYVKTNESMSTLHYLNATITTSDFLTLEPPTSTYPAVTLQDGRLAVAASSILCVQELTDFKPVPRDPAAARRYQRSPLRVHVGHYLLSGFIHCAPGLDTIERISSDRHPFFAMSSVSVVAADEQFAANFVAVRRDRVLLAQSIDDAMLLEGAEETATVVPSV